MNLAHAAHGALFVLATSSACTLAPVDIAQLSSEDDDEALGDPTWGEQTDVWLEGDLRDGVVELVELGKIARIFTSSPETAAGDTLRAIVLEVVAIDPPQLADDVELVLRDHEGRVIDAWVRVDERARFDGTLELGWSIELRATSMQRVELHAAFVEPP